MSAAQYQLKKEKNPRQQQWTRKTHIASPTDTHDNGHRPKHIVYIYNRGKRSEQRPKLQEDETNILKSQFYTMQQDAAI